MKQGGEWLMQPGQIKRLEAARSVSQNGGQTTFNLTAVFRVRVKITNARTQNLYINPGYYERCREVLQYVPISSTASVITRSLSSSFVTAFTVT